MLPDPQTVDLDSLRVGFAHRMNEVVSNAGNLEKFFRVTRKSTGKVSEWSNDAHTNWPEMRSFLEMVVRADISPSWLLLGRGPKRLSDL